MPSLLTWTRSELIILAGGPSLSWSLSIDSLQGTHQCSTKPGILFQSCNNHFLVWWFTNIFSKSSQEKSEKASMCWKEESQVGNLPRLGAFRQHQLQGNLVFFQFWRLSNCMHVFASKLQIRNSRGCLATDCKTLWKLPSRQGLSSIDVSQLKPTMMPHCRFCFVWFIFSFDHLNI